MSKQSLDFIIIGAAKSGTTTLFSILHESDQIFLPTGKELPFFTDDKLYDKGIDYLLKKAYKDAPKNTILGKITPQYMGGLHHNNPEVIAERIKSSLPDVKIIAILRDPVKRCLSHYRMAVRLGHEKRDYESAINELLKDTELEKARKVHTRTNDYVVNGEYGRILSYYFDRFDNDQLLILFTDDLNKDPSKVVRAILKFIGASDTQTVGNLAARSNVGGLEPKTSLLTPGTLYKIPFLQKIWENVIPFNIRHSVNQKIANWNIKEDTSVFVVPTEVDDKLYQHYADDTLLLEQFVKLKVPWRQDENKNT